MNFAVSLRRAFWSVFLTTSLLSITAILISSAHAAEHPPTDLGTNTIIVSHSANLREAAKIWPKPEGVAYFFKPLGNGKYRVVGKATPDQWSIVLRQHEDR